MRSWGERERIVSNRCVLENFGGPSGEVIGFGFYVDGSGPWMELGCKRCLSGGQEGVLVGVNS